MRGAEAYRAGQYDRAADAWRGLPGADARYNLGNALAKAGRYRDAIDAYDAALAREPGMEDAVANRAAVQALLDRMPPGEGGEPEGDDGGEGGDGAAGPPSGGDPANGSGDPSASGEGNADAPRETPGQSGSQGRDAAPPSEAGPSDAEAQRAADAAQRERMARALQAQEEAEGQDTGQAGSERDAPPGETPAERERRIANEAWLQRVPDDPGGLLRRKFALEYQRRQMEGIR